MNRRLSDIFKLVDNEILKHSEAVSVSVYAENRVLEIVAKCVKMVRKDSARNLEQQILSAYKLNDVSLEFVYDLNADRIIEVRLTNEG